MSARQADPWDVLQAAQARVRAAQDELDAAVDDRDRAFVQAAKTYTVTGLAKDLGISRQMATRILTRARDRNDEEGPL